jgi:Zn-dependent peptidase ImmA (M78 family)
MESPRPPRIQALTEQRLRLMQQQGFIDAEIAKRLGISRQAVSSARKRWNLPKGLRKRDVPAEHSNDDSV